MRIACVKALATSDEPTLIGFFEELIGDPDPVLRAESARAIGSMGSPPHARLLSRLLESDDFWVLRNSVEALIQLGMLGPVLLDRTYGRERFTSRAWSLIREAISERTLRRSMGRVA